MVNFWTLLKPPILALAPMAGVTDTAFRQMCKNGGADVVYNEFVSAEALVRDNKKTKEMLSYADMERPIVCQIFGHEGARLAEASKIVAEFGFDGVDINFGCPAYKVVKNGGGVSLMRDPARCAEIIAKVCEASPIPVSIKLRASISVGKKIMEKVDCPDECGLGAATALDILEKIKDLPVAAVMLHARTYEQPFDGEPQWQMVAEARKIYGGVLLANGGITTGQKAREVLAETGADGLGIARGAWGRPWIFQEIKNYLATSEISQKSRQEIIATMLEHAKLALTHGGEYGLIELRKHLGWYVKGWPNTSALRSKLVQIKTLAELKNILAQI